MSAVLPFSLLADGIYISGGVLLLVIIILLLVWIFR
jgi:hypothetical protein